ncbi:MAG: AMP-binding protein [Pseudonocardiales bacterium]|nr:AMP-binding protein [Pseudonocardiales bacterium]
MNHPFDGPEPEHAQVAAHTINLTAVADRIMGHESVRDCVLRVRRSCAGVAELVAYVVPTRQVSEEQILRVARPALPAAVTLTAVVFISDLPRTAGGRLDEAALAQFPVLDGDVAARWERRWTAWAGSGRAAVVMTPGRTPEGPLEPVRLAEPAGLSGSADGTSAPVRQGTTGTVHQQAPPSMSVGPPLRPLEVDTLDAALRRAALTGGPGEVGYLGPDGTLERQSYAELLDEASRLLGGLRGLGLSAGEKVIFQLAANREFVVAFWACVLGGFVAVPLAVASDAPSAATVKHAWESLGHPVTLTDQAHTAPLHALSEGREVLDSRIVVIDELRAGPAEHDWHATRAEDLVLLMFTSGSTGTPKAVQLRHDNLLTHAAAAQQHHDLTAAEVSFNWMPLHHVGGLIMFHVRDVVVGCRQIHAPTTWVLEDPLRWPSALHTHRATVTWAPNFAYGLVTEQAERITTQRWDLSALRVVLNAGEAVIDRVARRFVQLLAPQGLRADAMRPCWGMSETSSGQTCSVLPRDSGGGSDRAVEVGRPYPGFAIRITDDTATTVPEGTIGHVQVSGPAVTPGYYANPEQNREALTDDGWFRTGDLGLLREGALTITGRAKDVIIIAGVNHSSHELEATVEELDDVARSFTAACAVRTGAQATDELALFFVLAPHADPAAAMQRIRTKLVREAGVNPSYLIPVDKQQIPKTEIGKIQRSTLVRQFHDGAFEADIARVDVLLGTENTLPNWFFHPVWHPAELLHHRLPPTGGHTLILADPHELTERLAAALHAQGQGYTLASYGATFTRHTAERFTLPWDDTTAYHQLLDAIPTIERVVHLPCCAAYTAEPGPQDITTTHRDSVECLAHLMAALADHTTPPSANGTAEHSVRLYVVSSHSQQLHPNEPLAVERTPVIGLIKSLDQELPWLRARHIDIPPHAGPHTLEQLLTEIDTPASETEVALREQRRWTRRLVRLPSGTLPTTTPTSHETTPAFHDGGLYLISGGLGELAVEVARHLLTTHRLRLLLLGRTQLPDPSTWPRHIAHGTELGRKLSAYRALSTLGDITYAAVDITDPQALSQAVRTTEQHWSTNLAGVLHLAGHFDEHPITTQTPQHRTAVLAPKIAGGWALHQLLKNRPGTLFVSFSSLIGFFGGPWVSAYSAANTFLDALAAYQHHHCAINGRSLAWSIWHERGMSRGYGMNQLTAARGYHTLSTHQALRSLDAALRHHTPHILIGLDTDAPWARAHLHTPARPLHELVCYTQTTGNETPGIQPEDSLPDRYGTPTPCTLLTLDTLPTTTEGHIDREQLTQTGQTHTTNPTKDSQPATDLHRAIADIWCETLGRDRIGTQEDFFELGGDSMLATRMLGRLRATLDTHLTVATLIDNPTIEHLATRINQASNPRAKDTLQA